MSFRTIDDHITYHIINIAYHITRYRQIFYYITPYHILNHKSFTIFIPHNTISFFQNNTTRLAIIITYICGLIICVIFNKKANEMDDCSSDEASIEMRRKTTSPSPSSINHPEASLSSSSSSYSASATPAAIPSPDEPHVTSSSSMSSTVAVGGHSSVTAVMLHGIPIVSLQMDGKERLCLAQISNTLLKPYSYNEIHNRRVALGITCVQCTPVQLEILRRAGAMPVSSRRCGMITKREAERLVKSFLDDVTPPKLPDDFVFDVEHDCGWGCRGCFQPSRYNSSRAKCIRWVYCDVFFSPNKFIFHFHL